MRPRCADCGHFDGDAASVEAAFPGLSAMSSGYASVRGADGLCGLRGIYLPGGDACGRFEARGEQAGDQPRGHAPDAALPTAA